MKKSSDSVPDHTPVLVGIAAIQQRCANPNDAADAITLMRSAAAKAVDDSGNPSIVDSIELITVPRGMWTYTNPAALIAEHIGAQRSRTQLADFGILQQTLIGKACERIANGDIQAAMVVGGEARYRQLQAQIQQVELNDTAQDDDTPDSQLTPAAELWSDIEADAGLGMPVGYYAILESALCAAAGTSMDSHRDKIARRYQRFSEIAAGNPDAWSHIAGTGTMTASSIRDASDKNRMLAFPYTKLHNSQWNVDQACALLLCSAGLAAALDIPRERWVYPLASSESNQMLNVAQRPKLAESVAARLAAEHVLEHANKTVDDIDFIELYSCFPAAVNLYINALGISDERDVTVSGAMPFAGGPVNNFFLQASVALAKKLREHSNSYGLASCVSGMFTKQAYGLWSSTEPSTAFKFVDVSADVSEAQQAMTLVEPHQGEVKVVGCTVLFDNNKPERFVAVCEYPDATRTVSYTRDPVMMTTALERNRVGDSLFVDTDGQLTEAPLEK